MAILRKGAKSQTLQWASEWDGELLVFFLHQHFIFILSHFCLYLYQTQHVRRWTQASATQVFLHQHFILIVSISFIFIKLFSEWEGEHELQLLEFFCLHQQHLLSSWNLHSQPFLYMQLLSFSGSSMTWTAWHWFHFLMYHFRQADFPGPPDKNSDPKKWDIVYSRGMMINHYREDVCESKVEIVTPYWASNSNGKVGILLLWS